MNPALYDTIGATYTATRTADPLVAQRILTALGDARTVLDVGAGTGSYEPADRTVVAVEPSATMRGARPPDAAPCVRGFAEDLPFDAETFDAALAVLTVHHWSDVRAGLRELRRVARDRVVILHWDQDVMDRLWLAEYFPEAFAFDRAHRPGLREILAWLDLPAEVAPVPVPHDCRDGFAAAYWRRPHAYLDPEVRAGMSLLAQTEHLRGDGVHRLRRDLDDGTWAARHQDLLRRNDYDCGYRLITAHRR